jgi:ankyrin repeat protein
MAFLLLEKKADINIKIQNQNGSTALHLKSRNINEAIIKLFLKNKINIDVRDRYSITILHDTVC